MMPVGYVAKGGTVKKNRYEERYQELLDLINFDPEVHVGVDATGITYYYPAKYDSNIRVLHNTEGPARISYSKQNVRWYIHGWFHTFDEWCEQLDKTPEEKMILQLKYGECKSDGN